METLTYTDGATALAAGTLTLNFATQNPGQNSLAAYINGVQVGTTETVPGIYVFPESGAAAGYTLTEVLTYTVNPSVNGGLVNASGFVGITATPVPEPTTMVAGALLLLPFGMSTLRILRKRQAA